MSDPCILLPLDYVVMNMKRFNLLQIIILLSMNKIVKRYEEQYKKHSFLLHLFCVNNFSSFHVISFNFYSMNKLLCPKRN